MKSRILTILGSTALPASALAHPGHIVDSGQGHTHWELYALFGCVGIGLIVWSCMKVKARG